jgi:hypothetical protein
LKIESEIHAAGRTLPAACNTIIARPAGEPNCIGTAPAEISFMNQGV